MATTANVLTLLKFYAGKQKNPMIETSEFADYMHRYAQHHLDENPELVAYASVSSDALNEELSRLCEQKQIVISSIPGGKEFIYVVACYAEIFAQRYKDIEQNTLVPFPNTNDLNKHTPPEILTRVEAADIIYKLLEKQEVNDRIVYAIVFSKGVPAVIFPSSVPVYKLISAAMCKIQEMLKKEEQHDYFLKKLTISNPGKELSIKNFFATFVAKPEGALDVLKNTGETFYYWSQMCYFIKQDYVKLKDFTVEDINILQSVYIIEVATSFYKSKATEKNQKEAAFKVLDTYMQNPPYYFTMADVIAMKDPHGIPLLGQYNEKELKEHLNTLTQPTVGNDLPQVLIFKVGEGEGYFIFKEKVMPLILRLSSDARVVVKESLKKEWYKVLLEFETLPEMKDPVAFENCLRREVQSCQPVLYALLNSSFLPVISFEDNTPGKMTLFRDDELLPYSELLMISRSELLADAKIKLPFWYTIPVLSWIIALILKKPKKKGAKKQTHLATEIFHEEEIKKEHETELKLDNAEHNAERLSRKQELRKAAKTAEAKLVPENSSIDRELAGYENEWNAILGKKNRQNLTEDVNSLIRDYMRKILRTLPSSGFTLERIESLADTLVKSPSLMKIQNHPALKIYTELYMIKLVKQIP